MHHAALISSWSHRNLTVPSLRPIPSAALSSTSTSSSWNTGHEAASTLPGRLLRRKIFNSVSVWAVQYPGNGKAILADADVGFVEAGLPDGESGEGSIGCACGKDWTVMYRSRR
jgi:hypothetical protein